MSRTQSHFDALLERKNLSGRDRLSSLNKSIDSIERKLSEMGKRTAGGGSGHGDFHGRERTTVTGRPSKIAELEHRMQALSDNLEDRGGQYMSLRNRGRNFVQDLAGPGLPPLAHSGNALAEIAERKRLLNSAAQIPPAQHRKPTSFQSDKISDEIGELSAKIKSLRHELGGDLTSLQKSVSQNIRTESATDELERIANGIRELQQAPRFDPAAFDALHNDLDDIRLSLASPSQNEEINEGFGDITARLDHISSNMAPLPADALAEINTRLDTVAANISNRGTEDLANQIYALDGRVKKLSETASVENLDLRLQSLMETVQAMAGQPQKPEATDALEPNLAAIESRLDEITRAIVAVSVREQSIPSDDSQAFERLEQHLAELGNGLERIAQNSDEEQINQLNTRINNMTEQLQAMDANILSIGSNAMPVAGNSPEIEAQLQNLANRLDFDAVEKQRDDSQLSQLTTRIEGLTKRFGTFESAVQSSEARAAAPVNVVSDTSQIELQLNELASRIDAALDESSADQQLQNLEYQIADIASKLNGDIPSPINLANVEDQLGLLEQTIKSGQDETLEAVTQAAHSAIQSMEHQGFSGEVINALAEDLRALREAASEGEAISSDKLVAVQETLNGVVGRLGAIEQQLRRSSNNTTATAEHGQPMKSGSANPAAPIAGDRPADLGQVGLLEKVSAAPSIDPGDNIQSAPANKLEDNRPLEPGSGAPVMSAMGKPISEKLGKAIGAGGDPIAAGAKNGDEGKVDFVAAARRAARSAAANLQVADNIKPTKRTKKNEPENILSKLQNIRRKPIIIAAAAILLAVMAFAGSKLIFVDPGDTAVVAVNQNPTIAQPAPAENNHLLASNEGEIESPGITTEKPVKKVRPAVSNNENASLATTENGLDNGVRKPAQQLASSGFVANAPARQSNKLIAPAVTAENGPLASASVPTATGTDETVDGGANAPITHAPLPSVNLGPVTLRKAAAKGDVRAQHEIAIRYTNNKGVKKNLAEAAKWYERAAAQEFAPAQYRLGSLYEKGLGVKRDLVTATNWYRRAAKQGNAGAMHNLAVISAMGSGGKPDFAEALKWFTKAANFGVKDSQFNLGILYGQGMGVKQDLAESYKWFALAAKTGDADAAKKRDEVANAMDPKALAKARLAVDSWLPEKLNQDVNRVVIPEEWRGKNGSTSASQNGKAGVKQAQILLGKLGYDVGTPDGVVGPKTRSAILSFQRKSGIAPTGTISAELIKTLQGLSI